MKLTTKISKFAQQAKFLPKVKIIGSKDFVVKSLSRDAFITKDEETISPSEVGTIVDYLTRYVVLADEHAFDVANIKAREDLRRHVVSIDQVKKLIAEENKRAKMVVNLSDIEDLPDDAIILATDICAWEVAYRSGKYIAPKEYPDKLTINHIRTMINRVEQFFEKYGLPTKDAFTVHTKNGCLVGDGDYLLSSTLVDLKVSTSQKMQMYWVRQLLLYYALGFYNHVNDEQIDRLMIFNARSNGVYYVDISSIDKSVIEFVYETAENYSKVIEMKIKQILGI